jgi:hypothetical protein
MSRRDKKGKTTKKGGGEPRRHLMEGPLGRLTEALVCFAFIGCVVWGFHSYAFNSGKYNVKTIRVEGAIALSEAEIIKTSGVTSDDCIFLLDAGKVRERVAGMPYVRECWVEKIFPGRVIIRISEREALATLLVNNRAFAIDRDGHVLRELNQDEPPIGPFITDVADVGYVEVGKQLKQAPLHEAVAVWEAFRNTSMASEVTVSEICALRDTRVCMYCDDYGCEIRWGRGNLDAQAWKLDVFWKSQNKRIACNEYVDLRFGNDVVCR